MENDDRSGIGIGKALDAINQRKAEAPVTELFLLGILAGMYIGFGAIAATTVGAFEGLPVGLTKFLSGSVFCVGLILVVIPGSELFTGNVLMTAGLISRKLPFRKMIRNWLVVFLGNFVGSLLLAFAVYGSGVMGSASDPSPVGVHAAAIASAKIDLGFSQALLRGVLCNMLVCLAVMLAIASRTTVSKIMGIYFPITVFVLCGFEHSVANMYFLPAGLLAKGSFVSGFASMFNNLIPVTLGNIVGGMAIILLHPRRVRQLAHAIAGARHKEPPGEHDHP